MKKSEIGFLAAITLLFYSGAWATTERTEEAICPVSGTKMKVRVLISSNSFGGQDRDFCTHASGA